jgi:hypothetical protein
MRNKYGDLLCQSVRTDSESLNMKHSLASFTRTALCGDTHIGLNMGRTSTATSKRCSGTMGNGCWRQVTQKNAAVKLSCHAVLKMTKLRKPIPPISVRLISRCAIFTRLVTGSFSSRLHLVSLHVKQFRQKNGYDRFAEIFNSKVAKLYVNLCVYTAYARAHPSNFMMTKHYYHHHHTENSYLCGNVYPSHPIRTGKTWNGKWVSSGLVRFQTSLFIYNPFSHVFKLLVQNFARISSMLNKLWALGCEGVNTAYKPRLLSKASTSCLHNEPHYHRKRLWWSRQECIS